MPRTGPLADLSGLQLVAGALAAMTSAWMASWLGVAGTLIGAAVGSIVAGIATALYRSSLERGVQRSKTLLTEQGSVVESANDDDATADRGSEVVTSETDSISWTERLRRLNWRSIALVSGATLLAAVVIIGVYEVSTGKSYGNSSNPTIVPVSSSGGGAERGPGPGEDTDPSADPTSTAPTESAPTTQAPTGDAPTTQAPTTEAPTEPAQPNEGGESAPAE